MPTDCPVNDLIGVLNNTPVGPGRRVNAHVGRLLVQCQQVCSDWSETGGCSRHDRDEWIDILIRPGRDCVRSSLLELPPLGVVRGAAG